jgi:hypothetical protein
MKTTKKMMTLLLTTGISVYSFGQVNLGLSSTTQAATNAAINTTAITSVSNASTQAARATVSKVNDVKTTTTSFVSATGKQAASSASNASNVSVATSSGVSSQAGTGLGNNSAAVNHSSNADASITIEGSKVVDPVLSSTSTAVKEIKSGLASTTKSGVSTTKQAVSNATASANTGAEAKAESKAIVSGNNP